MHKVWRKEDLQKILYLPLGVQVMVGDTIETLNKHYGKDREINDMGGYVLVIEDKQDIKESSKIFHQDIGTLIPEYVNEVEGFTLSLILASSDYAIMLVMPKALTPQNLLKCLDEGSRANE